MEYNLLFLGFTSFVKALEFDYRNDLNILPYKFNVNNFNSLFKHNVPVKTWSIIATRIILVAYCKLRLLFF